MGNDSVVLCYCRIMTLGQIQAQVARWPRAAVFFVHNLAGGLVCFLPDRGRFIHRVAEAGADEPLTDQRKSRTFTRAGHGENAEKRLRNQKGTCAKDA